MWHSLLGNHLYVVVVWAAAAAARARTRIEREGMVGRCHRNLLCTKRKEIESWKLMRVTYRLI